MSVSSKLMLLGAAGSGGAAKTILMNSNSNLQVMDVTNPSSPIHLSTTSVSGARDFVYDGTTGVAYVATGTTNIVSVDMSDFSNPSVLQTYSNTQFSNTNALSLDVSNARLYVTGTDGTNNRVCTVDVSDPSSMSMTSYSAVAYPSSPRNPKNPVLDIANTSLYVPHATTDQFTRYDVSSPSSTSRGDSLSDATNLDYAHSADLDTTSGLAFVSAANSGRLTVVDISNPTMAVVGSVVLGSPIGYNCYDVVWDSVNNVCYVPSYSTGKVYVVDVSTPASPTIIRTVTGLYAPYRIALNEEDGLLYVSQFSSTAQLAIIDVSVPASASIVVNHNTGVFVSSRGMAIMTPGMETTRSR